MAFVSVRKLIRLSRSSGRMILISTCFCVAIYLVKLAYPERVIGPYGEKISENSSFFILENELNSISLSNETDKNETSFWRVPPSTNVTTDVYFDDNGGTKEKDFHDESRSLYGSTGFGNGTAGIKYTFGHEYPNKQLCPFHGRDLRGIIIVHSFPANRKKRMAIRRSWGPDASEKGLKVAFFLGQLDGGNTKAMVREEIERFGDIIIGNIVERYHELPLKTMSMLEWLTFYCNKVPFVVKSEDDVFINIINTMSYLELNEEKARAIHGRVLNLQPVRNPSSKYYIPRELYPGYRLPLFTQGFCYILQGEIAKDLFYTALNTTYMQYEDVFITGIVAHKLAIVKIRCHLFLNFKQGAPNLCQARKVIGMHKVTADQQGEMHAVVMGHRSCH